MLKLDEAIPQTIVVSRTGVTKNDKRNLSVRTNRLFQQLRNQEIPVSPPRSAQRDLQPMHRLLKRLRRQQHLDKLETTIGENDRRCDARQLSSPLPRRSLFLLFGFGDDLVNATSSVKRVLKVQSGQLKTTSLNSGLRKASPRPKRPQVRATAAAEKVTERTSSPPRLVGNRCEVLHW